MATRTLRLGSMDDIIQYDDGSFNAAIETDHVIKCATPGAADDVLRLGDVGAVTGDVYGPAAGTDNAAARFHGASGKTLQDSSVTIDDNGSVDIPTGEAYEVNSTQVVTDQQAAEADAAAISSISLGAGGDSVDRATFNTDLTAMVAEINAIRTTLNNLLAKLRTHGLIDT